MIIDPSRKPIHSSARIVFTYVVDAVRGGWFIQTHLTAMIKKYTDKIAAMIARDVARRGERGRVDVAPALACLASCNAYTQELVDTSPRAHRTAAVAGAAHFKEKL